MPLYHTVVVCGGRDYSDQETVTQTLHRLIREHGTRIVIHGGCRGADTLTENAARELGLVTKIEYADWDKFGKSAGPIRNTKMLTRYKPDLVVAFPGGRGTAHTVRIARSLNITVMEIPDD